MNRTSLVKNLANLISACRILLLAALFFLLSVPWLFLAVYLLCGISDILDGYVARKTKTESAFGARLDSVADFLLFAVITVALLVWMRDEARIFLPWVLAVAGIRFLNVVIAAIRYRKFAMLHTLGNKLTGLLLFFAPLSAACRLPGFLWFLCAAALLSAVEETIIHATSATLDLNRKTIFAKGKKQTLPRCAGDR